MAWTQEDLDIIKAAIAEGARTVQYGDKSVTYQSLTDMLRIKSAIEDELGIGKKRRTVADYRSGFHRNDAR